MFLISVLLASASSQNCVTNQTLGTYIYPTSGSQFALQLNNYFSGPGLQFTTSNPGFTIYNYVTGKSNPTNLFGTNTLVATAPLNLNYDPNVQTGIYAYLTQSTAGYVVYQGLQTSQGIQVQQVGVGISTPTYVTCYQLQYIANDSIVVSCLNSTNYQLFYYYNISLGILAAPIPVQTTNSIKLTGSIFSSFQVISTTAAQPQILGAVLYTSPTQNQSYVLTYQFAFNQASQISPLTITQLKSTTFQALFGYYINADQSVFYLTSTTLFYNSTAANLTYNQATQQFISLGVYPVLIQSQSKFYYSYYIALATQGGILNLYLNPLATRNQFNNQSQIPYPTGSIYQSNQLYQLFVNPQYVVYSTGNQVIVSPGYQTNQSYYLWTSGQINQYQITFDVRSSSFTLLSNTYTYYQIAPPILRATFSQSSQTGTFIVSATPNSGSTTPGTVCTVTFTYQSISPNTPYPLSTLSNNNNFTLPTSPTISYPDISQQVLSPYFYGSNMTYNATSDQPASFQIKQVQIQSYYNSKRITIQYSEVLQNPSNTNLYVVASQTSDQSLLNLQFCNAQGCLQDNNQVQINIANGQTVVASALTLPFGTINTNNTVLAITTSGQNNQILFFTFIWGIPKSQAQYPSSITLPTTFNWNIVNFIIQTNLVYVLTSTPQAVLVYSLTNLATPLYVINEELFTPRQLYQNQLVYPGYVFIDNTYELLIIQTVANTWTTVQNIQYPTQTGSATVGIGLVLDGIFIAQSDGNQNQFIQFYPKISANPFQLVSIAPNSVNVQVPTLATINTPVQSTFTSNKFYLSWTYNQTQQVGIFQPATGINNMLYYSQYVAGGSITTLSALSINTTQPFDIVDVLTAAETVLVVQNQTYVQFTPQMTTTSKLQYDITYTVTMPTTQSTQVTQNITVIDSNTYVDTKTNANLVQEANNVVLFKINPTQLFVGITQSYTAWIVNSSNTDQHLYQIPIIQPITKSNVNGNFQPTAYTTGTLHGLGGYTLGFAQNTTAVYSYYYDPTLKQQNYTLLYKFDAKTNYTYCPIIFTDTFSYQLISICNINTTGAYYQNYNYSSKTQTHAPITFNQTNGATNQIVNFPNVISGQYFNGLLILQFQGYFSFFTVVSNTSSVTYTLVQNYTIDASQVSSWSLFGVKTSNTQSYTGIMIVLPDLQTVRIVYQLSLTSANLNTPMLTQLVNFNPIIEQQIVSIQQATQSSQLDELSLVIQTNTVGYIYNLQLINTNQITVTAQQQNKLQQFGVLPAVGMQAQNGYIVTEFQTASQTVIGVYYDSQANQGTTLTFVGFYNATTTGSQPGNFTLTPNGTLFYSYASGFSQLYVTPEIYMTVNYSQVPRAAFSRINSTSDSVNMSFQINLTALNQVTNASQLLTIYNDIYLGAQPKANWSGSKNDWFGGFVGLFGAIVIGVIGYLCYKSRPQTFVERDI